MTTERTNQGLQIVIPGAERSARQLAAAREAAGRGRLRASKAQLPPDGIFSIQTPTQSDLFYQEGAKDR